MSAVNATSAHYRLTLEDGHFVITRTTVRPMIGDHWDCPVCHYPGRTVVRAERLFPHEIRETVLELPSEVRIREILDLYDAEEDGQHAGD
jgi:hypothetical protein